MIIFITVILGSWGSRCRCSGCGSGLGGGGSRGSRGGDRSCWDISSDGRGRSLLAGGRAENLESMRLSIQASRIKRTSTYLSDVNVGASCVDLGVVHVECRGVHAGDGGNLFAGVIELDDVCRCAILALVSQADVVTDLEVGALWVDVTKVDCRELVAIESASQSTAYEDANKATDVETLFAAEMESQISPALTV